MIIDITGVVLTPGNLGKGCPGNGENDSVECCCDECDYLMCCINEGDSQNCVNCTDIDCPCIVD